MHESLDEALRLHKSGRVGDAIRVYDALLARDPHDAELLHLRGVAAHQNGDSARAAELIGRAVARNPAAPAYHCNYAEALRGLGRLGEAEAHCRAALALRPDYPEALHNLGVVLSRQRRLPEAEAAYREALRLRPGGGRTAAALADVVREQGRIKEALAAYRRALDLAPDLPEAHANYGLLLVECGELEAGLHHCRQAVALEPDSPLAHHNLGRLLLEAGRIDEALDALAEALRRDRNSAALCLSIGLAWLELADYRQASSWFERALALDADRTEARCHLAAILLEVGNPEGAAEAYRAILAREPGCVEAHAGLARARLEQGDVTAAVADHREAIRLCPEAPGLHAALGYTLSTAGDLEGAVASFRKALEHNANCVPALAGLTTTLRARAEDRHIQQCEALLNAPWMTDARRAGLHFGLAQAYDGRGDSARAAEHMLAANALQKKHREDRDQGYSAEAHRRHIDRLIAGFTPDYFPRVAGLGRDSERPVFIVGMPRSGTTLAEQVLASHPAVHGAGERRFLDLGFAVLPQAVGRAGPPPACLGHVDRAAVQRIADWHLEQLHALDGGRAARVTDKMPDNYQLLGWIVTLFPRARIIHCRRDVRDVALSCWLTHFLRIRWANDLGHLAERINDYFRVMEHYRRVLPSPVFELDYEQMVADQEGTSRRLLAFTGLEWHPACLEFHRTERLVRTASVAQVRQPIYRRSVARWRRYEAMLRPLLERLRLPPGYDVSA
jgi:tetratricopeptide (TPR) repeat protein